MSLLEGAMSCKKVFTMIFLQNVRFMHCAGQETPGIISTKGILTDNYYIYK